jgi:hypothetical protein
MHDMQAAMQATQAMHSQIEQHGPALGISR